MPPETQEELITQAAEPVVPAEPVIVVEEEPPAEPAPVAPAVEAPPADPNTEIKQQMEELQKQVADAKEENDQLKYQQMKPAVTKPPTEPGVLTVPDPYSETYAQDMAVYTEEVSKRATTEAVKSLKDEIKGVQLLQGDMVFKESIKDTKEFFPDFDFRKEQKELEPLLQNGMTILQAKKNLEFDNMAERLKQLESGEVERGSLTPTTNTTSTKSQETKPNEIKITLSPEEKARAAKIGKTVEEFAKMKYNAQQRGEM